MLTTSDGSFGRVQHSRAVRRVGSLVFSVGLLWVLPSALHAGGSCTSNADCNLSPNFCRPGVCDIFGQCQYSHSDAICRVPPNGDNLYCNGDNFCNETTQACDVNPVNCQPPTPQCNEAMDSCVECLNSSHCTTPPNLICNASTGTCVECTSNQNCNDGLFCNGQETCNQGACQDGTPVNCSGGTFCSEAFSGLCVQCENDGDCNDNLYCNGVETCAEATHTCNNPADIACKTCNGGLVAGTPCLASAECQVCSGGSNAGQPCTVPGDCPGGSCPAGGTCTGPSSFCNETNDSCVQCLADAHCNDAKFCTADSCIFNTCSNVPDPQQFCSDNVFCNGSETCNASTGACGAGAPPTCSKTCFRGVAAGTVCTSDAGCGKACDAGFRVGLTCNVDADCGGGCVGGDDDGESCATGDTCDTNVCQSGLCIPGLCRGGCSEASDACVQCAADVVGSTSCSDSLFCDGNESCNAQHLCVAGSNINCSGLDDQPCAIGKCNESTDQCARTANPTSPNGTPCDDADECTRVDYCQNTFCVENPAGANDPYRCVVMEWRPTTTQAVVVGSTVSVDLYLVAQNCNTPNDDCTATQASLNGVQAILQWDPAVLQLKPSVSGDRNPQDPCDNGNSCFVCAGVCSGGTRNGLSCDNVTTLCPGGLCNPSPATYNWSSSLFPNDCGIDGLNQPCSGFPANDGNALYTAIPQLSCGANPARLPCATTSGLNVTKIKFKALSIPSGGMTSVSLLPCFGDNTSSKVVSGILPPAGYTSSDVTKSLGPPAAIQVVSCGTAADCVDADGCTIDSCVAGTCRHDPMNCTDPDLCTVDSCSNGVCSHIPIDCGAGNRCFQGGCYRACVTVADCDDGVACTTDVCTAVPGEDICQHTTNDAACNTGLFCSAQVCDLTLGCVFDHTCVSANGNPCENGAGCNEANDDCGGCLTPTATGVGGRYLQVVPNPAQGSTPVAVLIEGDCDESAVSCVSKYLAPRCVGGTNDGLSCQSDANCPKLCQGGTNHGNPCATDANCPAGSCRGACDKGFLGDVPAYLPGSSWGTVQVHGADIRPNALYHVYSVCNFGSPVTVSAASRIRTPKWGDTNNDPLHVIDFADISAVVNAFRNFYSPLETYQSTNIMGSGANACGDVQLGCVGQECLNFGDVAGAVDAFRGVQYPCAAICP